MRLPTLGSAVLIAIALTFVANLSGCTSQPTRYVNASAPSRSFDPGTHVHRYSVTITDVKGQLIPNATVEWRLGTEGGATETKTQVTADNGSSNIDITVTPKLSTAIKWADYKSTAEVTVRAAGYESQTRTLTSSSYVSSSSSSQPTPQSEKIRLIKPTDYLASDFIESKQYSPLRTKVLDFLALIRLQSLLNQAELKLGGIRMQEFKGRRYLVIEVNSENVYNSLKLDRYAVGKQIFDESVRKILNPLNDKISDPKLFYGYNLIVNTRTKSFSEKYAIGDAMKYEFLMPQGSVKSYKDKDISGQKLIDDSVVLLNDERIDLKFQ